MNTYIALLRGINVGGKNKLPMRALVTLLEELGLNNVKTYIQSGNVVFQSEHTDTLALSQEISNAIGKSHGFSPQILILDTQELQEAIAANPFPKGEDEPKTLHLYFFDAIPNDPDFEALERLKTDSERYRLINKVFYLHAPDGIGRSKLAENVGKGWGAANTARNWRTVSKVMSMALELES
ncbi:DUF1697 domain-containing protein [Chloroflexi bacterium TSY]|nr:DUF1697 domain-containing protein [Chloroflexi bacterium TSY]